MTGSVRVAWRVALTIAGLGMTFRPAEDVMGKTRRDRRQFYPGRD